MSKGRHNNGTFKFGHTTSVEIRKKISNTLSKTGDITGKKFGSWTALEQRPSRKNCGYWLCRCDCGIEKEVMQRNLIKGSSTGCMKCSGNKNSLRARLRNVPINGRYRWKSNGFCRFARNAGRKDNWWDEVRRSQFNKQNGICSVCLKTLSSPAEAFDHDHKNGLCRELMHRGCNVFVGFIENHPGVIERVEEYLEKYDEK
jgi:hypothetical protein